MSEVSVVVPTYNGARFLAETLSAIGSQTEPPRELVVVDDYSSDDSAAIAAAHPGVTRVVRVESNQGVCHARNRGIAATTGSLVAFCDQDDLWSPRKLETQVAAFARNPDVDFLFSNFRYRHGDMVDQTEKFDQAPNGWWAIAAAEHREDCTLLVHLALPHLLRFQPVFPSTVMVRRSLFDRAGTFDEALGRERSEDLEFLLRCDSVCRIAALVQPLVTIRRHGSNYSSDNTKTTLSQIRILKAMADGQNERYGPFRFEIKQQLHQRSVSVIDGAFASGDLETCRSVRQFLGPDRSLKLRIKVSIALLPGFLARPLRSIMVRDGA